MESLVFFIIIIIIIIIIKTSSTGPSGKNKIVNNLPTQPHKYLSHEKTEKQTQGSNKQLTALPKTHLTF